MLPWVHVYGPARGNLAPVKSIFMRSHVERANSRDSAVAQPLMLVLLWV